MRAFLAMLALAASLAPVAAHEPDPEKWAPVFRQDDAQTNSVHLAQMGRDVTDAVRKQRAERRTRSHPDRRSTPEAGR